jgi:long-chain acyl-CoA synthetase
VKVYGEYKWKTYKEVGALRDAVGSALMKRGMAPPNDLNHRAVGLYSKNREEWVVAEQACHAYGLVDVALYDTLGEEAIHFIVEQTGMATVFASGELAPKLVAAKKAASLPSFKFVVSFDAVSAALVAEAAAVGLTLLEFKALAAEGAASPLPHTPPSPMTWPSSATPRAPRACPRGP